MVDAKLFASADIDWSKFYIGNVPSLLTQCFQAYGLSQPVMFTDEAPLQASYNTIDPSVTPSANMCVGLGNLGLYPFATLVAVILHELGHNLSCQSKWWDSIQSTASQKQVELLADFLAGAAFADMERRGVTVTERVSGQCSELVLPWMAKPRAESPKPTAFPKAVLNPRRLLTGGQGQAQFDVLRGDGTIEALPSYAMIGTMPDEDPSEQKCMTDHSRKVDFLAMVGAVSSWRTFGDRPDTDSHGSPSERYNAFSQGYAQRRPASPLIKSIPSGAKFLEIRT